MVSEACSLVCNNHAVKVPVGQVVNVVHYLSRMPVDSYNAKNLLLADLGSHVSSCTFGPQLRFFLGLARRAERCENPSPSPYEGNYDVLGSAVRRLIIALRPFCPALVSTPRRARRICGPKVK